MSEIIDFYTRFTSDYIAWCQKHPDIASDEDKLDEILPLQSRKWYSSPKKWLNGKTPNQYFEEINDEKIYVSLFVSYIESDMNLPEPLIDCMINMKQRVYPIIRNILYVDGGKDISPDSLADVRAKIISLIDEMRMEHPYGRYISLLLEYAGDNDLTDAVCIALEETDKPDEVRKALLDSYPVSEGASKQCILDLLCGFEDTDGMVFSILNEELIRDDIPLAYTAELAGKLGDERLLDRLNSALNYKENDYVTYTAVKYAIERITGEEIEDTADFSGDADYELLSNWKDEDEKI